MCVREIVCGRESECERMCVCLYEGHVSERESVCVSERGKSVCEREMSVCENERENSV